MFSFKKKRNEVIETESESIKIITFRYYLIIVATLFFIASIIDMVVDFKAASLSSLLVLAIVPIIFLILSLKGVSHRWLVLTNMACILLLNQAQLLANPMGFHVLVFWIGLSPLLGAVLLGIRETVSWAILILIFILVNGLYISDSLNAYEMTLYPGRFTYGGLLFTLMIAMVAILFSYTNYLNHKRLSDQNLKLKTLAEEIEVQHEKLVQQHEEITTINSKLEENNQNLERRVHERTEELEAKNRDLTEYAFINSHLLRGPLSRILGLIDLLNKTSLTEKEKEIIDHLDVAGADLDDVIAKINKAIDSGHTFDRETLRKLKL